MSSARNSEEISEISWFPFVSYFLSLPDLDPMKNHTDMKINKKSTTVLICTILYILWRNTWYRELKWRVVIWSFCETIPFNFMAAAVIAKSLQSCLTLCDPIDGSPPDSPVPGILHTRTLEWVAISFSSAWERKGKMKSLSHVRLLATSWTAAYQAPPSMGFSRQQYTTTTRKLIYSR